MASATVSPFFAAGIGDLMPLIIIVIVAINVIRALLQAQKARQQHEATDDETEDDRRAREIRERLRRVIEERRAGSQAPDVPRAEPPPLSEAPRPVPPQPSRIPPIDPFGGGTMRRWVETLAPKPASVPKLPPAVPREPVQSSPVRPVTAKVLEPAEVFTEGPQTPARFAHANPGSDPQAAQRAAARERLVDDLRNADALRRAFVLREVLGPPVALRQAK